jgi:hypothetical protein
VILFFALCPQLALHKGEPAIDRVVAPAAAISGSQDDVSDARTPVKVVIR